jgi:hypothetical protein
MGGLGVRDLRLVNISLLAKWRWKLLSSKKEVWKDVVAAKYGDDVLFNARPMHGAVDRLASKWWVDICSVDNNNNWFSGAVDLRVGDGKLTKFWTDIWLGDQPFCDVFSRLYNISIQKNASVFELGNWNSGQWRWDLRWRRVFFEWEEDLLRQLEQIIMGFTPSVSTDAWNWRANGEDGFTVKSCYDLLYTSLGPARGSDLLFDFVFSNVWKCAAPSKICAFSWQLLLDRIQTKDNLWRRRMINEQQCMFCVGNIETSVHLFLHCAVAAKVWYGVMKWLGLFLTIPPNLSISLAIFAGCARDKATKEVLILIWNAFVWVIWRNRNNRVFNNKAADYTEMVDQVQLLSWKWYISRKAKNPCMLYEWSWSPWECFHR